jgi:hypothetical protein
MTPELEKFFDSYRSLFRNDGWKLLTEELLVTLQTVDSVVAAKDEQDLYFRKGQLAVLQNILNLENQIEMAAEQAEEDVESI